jgi:hypothetical protein
VVAINRNAWSQSIGTAGRDHPVRADWKSKITVSKVKNLDAIGEMGHSQIKESIES